MKLPLIRIGITLAVGSVLASVVHFYVALGPVAADIHGREPPRKELVEWFLRDFLFTGKIPSLLFWTGVVIALLGNIPMLLRIAGGGRRAADPHAAIRHAIEEHHRRSGGGVKPPGGEGGPSGDRPG